jgi:SAM-dependent methyltransferase
MGETPRGVPGIDGERYDARFAALERAGRYLHGEADLVASLGVASVLDAGCGTGRVAIELARRGFQVVGVDRDADMIRVARQKAPHLEWCLADLAGLELFDPHAPEGRRFEAIVLAGNVMIFLDLGTEEVVVHSLARHLAPGGFLVAGFQLQPGGLALEHYDLYAARAGLELVERWATWERGVWDRRSDYAVSVHRRPTEP